MPDQKLSSCIHTLTELSTAGNFSVASIDGEKGATWLRWRLEN